MNSNKINIFDEIHTLMRKKRYGTIVQCMLSPNGTKLQKEYKINVNHAFYILGDLEFKRKKYLRASYFFGRAIKARNDDISAMLALGNCFDAMKLPAKAKSILQKALALSPKDQFVRFNLANAYFDLGNFDEATFLFKTVAKSRNSSLSEKAKRNLKILKPKMKANR